VAALSSYLVAAFAKKAGTAAGPRFLDERYYSLILRAAIE
jgi:hypothetical protein